MGLREIIRKAATPNMSWQQSIDFACAMVGVTERHIEIDSARAVVHASWTRLGRQDRRDITFNEILALVNSEPAVTVPWPAPVSIAKPAANPLSTSPP